MFAIHLEENFMFKYIIFYLRRGRRGFAIENIKLKFQMTDEISERSQDPFSG